MPKAPSHVDQHLNRFYKRVKGKLAAIEATAKHGKADNKLALDALGKLKPLTEYINQFHHEYVCIQALRRLKKEHPDLGWNWFPSNTGGSDAADIEGRDRSGKLIVAAECSASIEPKGTLRQRMNDTLAKLSKIKAAKRYYFTKNKEMEQAANNKAELMKYRILAYKVG